MSKHRNLDLIRDIRPKLRVNPAEYADTTFQALSEKIADDYNVIIKNCVLPTIKDRSGLKMRELRVMACLDFYDMPLTPAHVAAMLRYDPATVTRAVGCLVKAGMVSRTGNERDTRSVVLNLTEKGASLAALYAHRVKTTFNTLEMMIEKSLSPEEKTQFLTILYKISRRTSSMRRHSARLPDLNEERDPALLGFAQ